MIIDKMVVKKKARDKKQKSKKHYRLGFRRLIESN